MESTVSVSKGVFLFTNGFKIGKKAAKKKRGLTLFEKKFTKELWYVTFKKNWSDIESELLDLHNKTYSLLLNDVVSHIKHCSGETSTLQGVIPSATLVTGVSQPDHVSQFTSLISILREEVTPHVALVSSQDAASIKHLIENTVWQLIHGSDALDIDYDDDETEITSLTKKLKKNQCTMKVLKNWYLSKSSSPKKKNTLILKRNLVIIIPDFECFNSNVLQDFVLILSCYISTLPIVLVFGVATSVSALHKVFPYRVSSKLLIKVFHSHSSPVYMNQVLEDIFLKHNTPFHLSGKALGLITDVFLFYDFSVTGLIQSIKYCMMEHFYGDNTKSLCSTRDMLRNNITKLNSEDLENIRRLISFRSYLEQQDARTKISLFEDDNFFRQAFYKTMDKVHDYLQNFYMCVRVLFVLVKELPKNILGKSIREICTKCTMESITDTAEFKECMQLLKFQSQIILVESIKNALNIVNVYAQDKTPVTPLKSPAKYNINNNDLNENFAKSVRVSLLMFLKQIENANTESTVSVNALTEHSINNENVQGSRYKLKETLFKATRMDKIQSEFEMIRSRFVNYLENILREGLQPAHTQTFHELLFFSDVSNVKKHIVGSPRGAVHTALSNPVHYLQCPCCHLSSADSVIDTLPDVCLVYKLHLECGKHINLYDWLQAFAAVVRRDEDHEHRHEDPVIQMRFTRAVAELQYLGFIKSSKRKTDHVIRLTS